MAEIAASIIGISNFGIKLTQTLYEFGANAASAKEHTDYIARHVNLYASTLDLLADRLEDEANDSLMSNRAFDLVKELYEQSLELFTKIKKMLPKRRDEKDDLSFLQKIGWNFKKSAIDCLICEINYLKSTVTLIVTILFTGKKIRSCLQVRKSLTFKIEANQECRRRKGKISKDKSEVEGENLNSQFVKARNDIMEHIDSGEVLSKLPEGTEISHTASFEGVSANKKRGDPPADHAVILVSKQDEVVLAFRNSLIPVEDPLERRVIVL